jgi:hypothetical protein
MAMPLMKRKTKRKRSSICGRVEDVWIVAKRYVQAVVRSSIAYE